MTTETTVAPLKVLCEETATKLLGGRAGQTFECDTCGQHVTLLSGAIVPRHYRQVLDRTAVATHLGWKRESVTRYLTGARADLYAFPQPDGRIGDSPWWFDSTIDEWIAARPGRGRKPSEVDA